MVKPSEKPLLTMKGRSKLNHQAQVTWEIISDHVKTLRIASFRSHLYRLKKMKLPKI